MRAITWRADALALLIVLLLAGCGVSTANGTLTSQKTSGPPDRVHIVRTISGWLTNGGRTPAPAPADVTSTDAARVTQFYSHIISLPTYVIPPNAVTPCPAAFGQAETLITFFHGTGTIQQVKVVDEGCVFVSIVGSPQGTYLRADDAFFQELEGLIANPA
jgi:hypothetical protein